MAINAVEKFGLEQLAYDLKNAGKSYSEIAEMLSQTAGAKISKSMVFRYFESHESVREEIVQNILDRNETLVATSMAQTLDVNGMRIRLTSSLMVLMDQKLQEKGYKDGKEIAALAKEIREGLNDIDQTTSSLLPLGGAIEHNLGATLTDDQLLRALRLTETDN
jgi:AcrR family transcriptional regulator